MSRLDASTAPPPYASPFKAPIVGLMHSPICHAYSGLLGSAGGGVSFSAFRVIS